MARTNPIKSSLLLLALAGVIVAISYFVIAPQQKEAKETEKNSALLFEGIKREEILSFEIVNSHGSFVLNRAAKDSSQWFLEFEESNYSADQEAVIGLISTLIASKRDEELEPPPLEQVGLASPKMKIGIRGPQSKVTRYLEIGNDTPVNYFVYAKWSDQPDVFLTTRSIRFGVDKSLKDLRNKEPLSIDLSKLSEITFKSTGQAGLSKTQFHLVKSNGQWNSKHPQEAKIDEEALKNWLKAAEKIKAVAFPGEGPESKQKFSLNNPAATLSLSDEKGKKETWRLSAVSSKRGAATVETYYLDESSQASVYELNTSARDAFKLDFFQIRDKTVSNFSTTEVDKVRIENKKNFIELKKSGESWNATSSFKGFEASKAFSDPIDRLLKATSSLKASGFHDGVSEWKTGLKNPSRSISLYKGNTLLAQFDIGKATTEQETIIKSSQNRSPASVLVNFNEIASLKPELFIDKAAPKEEKKAAPTKKKTGDKMEKTVETLKELKKLPEPIVKPGHAYSAEIQVAGKGKITIVFNAEKAPYTVSNFLHLGRNGFYDGVKFHRVIKDFVAQGGDPTGNGTGGPGWIFDYEDNDLKHIEGSISMAHAQDINTNGSQFFLVHKPQPHLDGVHTVFGQIKSGLDVMYAIEAGDVMEKVEVFEKAQ